MKASVFISWLRYTVVNKWGYIWGKCGITWTAKLQAALEKKYNSDPGKYSNYKSAVLYGARWFGHKVADCANLIRWAAKQAGDGSIHAGSNLIFDFDIAAKGQLSNGQRTDGHPLKPGTLVFTGENKGEHGHVGGYAGNGEVIEDVGTHTGVVTSKVTNGKWKWWGEPKHMEFDVPEGEYVPAAEMPENGPEQPEQPADGNTPATGRQTLRKGAKGADVKYLQELLQARGYSLGKYGVDGDFGSATEKAVKQFQKDWNLQQDGVVGPKTWAMLQSTPVKEILYTVTISHLPAVTADEIINKYGGVKDAEG